MMICELWYHVKLRECPIERFWMRPLGLRDYPRSIYNIRQNENDIEKIFGEGYTQNFPDAGILDMVVITSYGICGM